eukprot:6204403-Pleurochrysis_carterae.AAC.4
MEYSSCFGGPRAKKQTSIKRRLRSAAPLATSFMLTTKGRPRKEQPACARRELSQKVISEDSCDRRA